MKNFLDEDFLLTNETGRKLFHEVAEHLPIFDFHCHLSPKEIYEDKKFRSITDAWLGGDHYKWRALRANGVPEEFITGEKTDWEKFEKWAATVPDTFGNPLYHWTHLELQRYFGVTENLSSVNASSIFERCNAKLVHMTARDIIRQSNVDVICTTDDPIDDLRFHELIAKDHSFTTRVYPAFRPDKAVNIQAPTFRPWIDKLVALTHPITTFAQLTDSLKMRIDYFHIHKCRLSDHALDEVVYEEATDEEVTAILRKALAGETLSSKEVAQYKTKVMVFLGKTYAKLEWTQQYHVKALRNINERMMKFLGPDTGFDAVDDRPIAAPLAKLMSAMDATDELPRTILYSLNGHDNETLAAIAYGFQGGKIPGKIQLGSAWWFNDQKHGMQKQLEVLADFGLLSRFVGMLTDSRSFLSYTRHEYFRRILCDFIGKVVEDGEYPKDEAFLKKIVTDICYDNAVHFFRLP